MLGPPAILDNWPHSESKGRGEAASEDGPELAEPRPNDVNNEDCPNSGSKRRCRFPSADIGTSATEVL